MYIVCLIACSHRRHGQDKTVLSCPCRQCEHNCRQDKTVLSCPCRQCEHNCRQDKTVLSCPCRQCEHNCRQDKTVLSCLDPVSNLRLFSLLIYWGLLNNWKLETGRVKTKLSCFVRVGGVNKLLLTAMTEMKAWFSVGDVVFQWAKLLVTLCSRSSRSTATSFS